MRVQIQGKTFDIDLFEDHALVLEYNKHGKRWIKFPLRVISWVSDVFELCSSFEDLSFEKSYGFLSWRISTRQNKWGWVLEISVRIKGISYSIFVPGESSLQPWSRFINSFRHAVSGKRSLLNHGVETHSDPYTFLISDMIILPNRNLELLEENRSLKEGVDGILANECQERVPMSQVVDVSPSSIGQESLKSVGQNIEVHDLEICDMMEEANEIREASLMSDNAYLSFGHFINVVTSLLYLKGGRKKKKPSSIAVVQFVDPVFSEVCSLNVKPTISARMNKRKSLFVDHESSWDRLSLGVKKHHITKYNERPNLEINREWVIVALELDGEASEKDIFKRMYQFQKIGKIQISKKVIRIPED